MIDTIFLAIITLLLGLIGWGARSFYGEIIKWRDEVSVWKTEISSLVSSIDKRIYHLEIINGISERERPQDD